MVHTQYVNIQHRRTEMDPAPLMALCRHDDILVEKKSEE